MQELDYKIQIAYMDDIVVIGKTQEEIKTLAELLTKKNIYGTIGKRKQNLSRENYNQQRISVN